MKMIIFLLDVMVRLLDIMSSPGPHRPIHRLRHEKTPT